MSNFFQRPLRLPKVPHSFEDMSHNFKTTTKFGLLTPVGLEEVVPADQTRSYSPSAFMRLSPLLYPIMHRVNARMHTFEVPFRLILGDDLYQEWLTDKFEFPDVYITASLTEAEYNALPKYDIFTTLGYTRRPFDSEAETQTLYVLPNGFDFFACALIWRDWYADSIIDEYSIGVIDKIIEDYRVQLQESIIVIQYSVVPSQLYARLGPDYFTTARPEPEYGDPVNLTGSPTSFKAPNNVSSGVISQYAPDNYGKDNIHLGDSDANALTIDLTIRELWRREQIQRFWDVTNTFGTRTREWLAGHFGVIFPDDRLQIPRLLQIDNHSFNIAEVLQTSASTESSPLGAYAGKGTLAFRGKTFKRFYVEHGLVITLLSVVPVNGYSNGLQRFQLKKSVFDFALPEFNNIGFQEIYKGELFETPGVFDDGEYKSTNRDAWAYTMRYSEYRSHPNRCSNGFRDDSVLRDFHLNRFFDDVPGLNPNFITANQEQFYRIFADELADMDSILVDCAILHKMYRPVSSQPSSMHL